MEAKMRQEVKKVVKQNEELELALKRALWEKEDILKEKQFEIQRLVKQRIWEPEKFSFSFKFSLYSLIEQLLGTMYLPTHFMPLFFFYASIKT